MEGQRRALRFMRFVLGADGFLFTGLGFDEGATCLLAQQGC